MCIPQLRHSFHPAGRVDVAFDAPHLSSDGGALLLRQVDDRLGLSKWLAKGLPDDRDASRVIHSRREQVRQRLFQIALGYEDCNDATRLRHDPMLRTVCDLEPRGRERLSSQPTLSRFENAVSMGDVRSLLLRFEQEYVDSLPADTGEVILDIDSTADETHGRQQLSFFHGFYDQHMYHPLLVFDGVSGQLVTAILRPGNTHAARGALGVLRRIVTRLKARLPDVHVVVRGDSGFCVPRLLTLFENLDQEYGQVDYLLGIARNKVLEHRLAPAMSEAQARFAATRHASRVFVDFSYAAKSWPKERHVVGKAEYHRYGPNPRFIITSLTDFEPRLLYRAYCQRGQAENFIKDLKSGLNADRLSCHRFETNSFRLLLHAAAYRLLFALRQEVKVVDAEAGRHEFKTLRLRLLKVGVLVRQSVRRILLRFPHAFPLAVTFRAVSARLALPKPAT